MIYLLCSLAYLAAIAVMLYGFSKLRRTCPVCDGTGVSHKRPRSGGPCPACQGEGKL